ncbi:glycosyltransferase [Flavobacterium facile]|uniref:glycosyltransferase n=1 Tax=Flavobacterium facile TaxID=2893174 RepID=UPI002E788981|nr:glycosyltransferase [Flavobacterium sp. T-12]
MRSPLVSIIIPVFNDEKFIKETIQSVKNQVYINWECIIVNDGSVDSSESIIQNEISNDSRFTYVFKENSGVSDTRNLAIKQAKGEFILPLDSDDLISVNYILDCVAVFEKQPNTKLVYCKAEFFGEKKGAFKLRAYFYKDLIVRNSIFCSAMYKKADYLNTDGYDSNLKLGLEDWEFWIQLLDENCKVVKINKVHFYYRIKEISRNSIHENDSKLKQIHEYIFNKHKALYEDLLFKGHPKLDSVYNLVHAVNELTKIKKSFGYQIYKMEREIKKLFVK